MDEKNLQEATARDKGLCCDSCQEDLEICPVCGLEFEDGDLIFCEAHSQSDCVHYHKRCGDFE